MTRSLIVSALSLALLAAALPAHGQVYRWVDAQGRVHYGDVASAPRSAKPANLDVPRPASERSPLDRRWEQTSDAASSPSVPAPSEPVVDDATVQACEVARRNRDLLADEGRDVLDDSGEQVMSESARAQRLARVELEIEAFCNVLGADGGGNP